MKLRSALPILASLLLLPVFGARAQAPEHSARFPQGSGSWRVKVIQQPKGKQDAPPKEQVAGDGELRPTGAVGEEGPRVYIADTIEVERDAKFTRSRTTWTDGSHLEIWWIKDLSMVLRERMGDSDEIDVDTLMLGLTDFLPDERLFRWLDSKSFAGTKKYRGRDCLYFTGSALNFEQAPNEKHEFQPIREAREAWLDPETMFPVALRDLDTVYEFTLQTPPSSLALPERFAKKLQETMDAAPKPQVLSKPRSWEANRAP